MAGEPDAKARGAARSPEWTARNRRIWGTANAVFRKDVEEQVRDLVEECTGARSISGMTEAQQVEVIRILDAEQAKVLGKRRRAKKRISGTTTPEVTPAQIGRIRGLAERMGWGPPALRKWLKRCFGADREEWLPAGKATNAITALAAMVKRKEAV